MQQVEAESPGSSLLFSLQVTASPLGCWWIRPRALIHLISSSHAESSRVSLSPSCIVLSISPSASVVGQAGQHEDHLANGLTAVIVISSPFMQKPLESPAGRHGLSIMTISTWADRGPQARDAEISWSSSLRPVAVGMDHSFVHVPPASFSLARVNQL